MPEKYEVLVMEFSRIVRECDFSNQEIRAALQSIGSAWRRFGRNGSTEGPAKCGQGKGFEMETFTEEEEALAPYDSDEAARQIMEAKQTAKASAKAANDAGNVCRIASIAFDRLAMLKIDAARRAAGEASRACYDAAQWNDGFGPRSNPEWLEMSNTWREVERGHSEDHEGD